MEHQASIKLTVSTQGYIRAYQGETQNYGFFQKGKHLSETAHINDKIALMTLLDNARMGKKDNNSQSFRFLDIDGTFTSFQMSNATLGINGISIDCQLVDEKAAKETPSAESFSSNKTSNDIQNQLPLFTLAAHEMREPLNAIIGFSDFLIHEFAGTLETQKQRQYAQHIKDSGNHLLELIIAYLEKQELQNAPIDQDVDSTIAEAIAITGHRTKNRKVVFEPSCHKNYYTTLKSFQLKQVLINLITNAAKYSGDDSIITIQQRVLKNNNLLITVSDTGTGIAEEDIKELCQPFKRADNVLSSDIDGQGIGLSLVFGIVEAAKGSVTISSRKNRGTTISITLPLGNGPMIDAHLKQQKSDCNNLHLLSMNDKNQAAKLHEKYLGDGKSKNKINKTA